MPGSLTRARRCAALAPPLLVAAASAAASLPPPADTTLLVSRQDGAGSGSGGARSVSPSLSASGRYVAFVSGARNLTPGDRDDVRDVFVRDVARGTTALVSRANGRRGAGANGHSLRPRISASGRYVAFESSASNLSPSDRDHRTHVYVRDLRRARTVLVSRAAGRRGAVASAHATGASISADGRRVAFDSPAANLTAADDDHALNRYDVFVRDLRRGRTELVSRASGARGAAGSASAQARISADGRWVAFDSGSTRLTREGNRAVLQVYVRDLRHRRTLLVSRAGGRRGRPAAITSSQPVISANGRFVAFESRDARLGPGDGHRFDLFVRDLRRHTTRLITPGGATAGGGEAPPECYSISGNGRYAGFERRVGGRTAVFVRDLRRGRSLLASRASGASGSPAGEDSGCPSLSGRGQVVAFESAAAGLDPVDQDASEDVFLRRLSWP